MLNSGQRGFARLGLALVCLVSLTTLGVIVVNGQWQRFVAVAIGLSLAGLLLAVWAAWKQNKLICALDGEVLRLARIAKTAHKPGHEQASESLLAQAPMLKDVLGIQAAALLAAKTQSTTLVPIGSFGVSSSLSNIELDEDTKRTLESGDTATICPLNASSLAPLVAEELGDSRATLIPIAGPQRLLGVLCLVYPPEREFHDDDRERLHACSSSIGQPWYRATVVESFAKHNGGLLDPLTRSGRTRRIETLSILGDSPKPDDPLFSSVVDSIADGVVVSDVFGNIRFLNPTAMRILQSPSESAIGSSAVELIGDRSNLRLDSLARHFRLVVDDEQFVDIEAKIIASGSRDYRLSLSPLRSEDGRIEGVVAVVSDITKLKDMDQLKSDLMSMVTHEIRTPLATVRGFAQILLKGGVDEEKSREFLEIVNRQSNRLVNLVNDFLDISRIESGRQAVSKVPMNMERLIQLVLSDLKPLADDKGVALRYQPARIAPPEVCADRNLMEQVLINLVSNSIKYSRKGAHTVIRTTHTPHRITVRIEDNGLGIPKEAVPRVFEKFFRVRSDDRSDIIGTGLGLSLVKQIIDCHAGEIKVDSELGQGSTFAFSLPLGVSPLARSEAVDQESDLAFQDRYEINHA